MPSILQPGVHKGKTVKAKKAGASSGVGRLRNAEKATVPALTKAPFNRSRRT